MRLAGPFDKEVRSGRLVNLLNPTLDDIDLQDIATSLAQTTRYGGHAPWRYSNLQHSRLVAMLLPEPLKIHGWLHDAPETYIGDLSTPMKRTLESLIPDFRQIWSGIEEKFEVLIYKKLGVELPDAETRALVKQADLDALVIEQVILFCNPNGGLRNIWGDFRKPEKCPDIASWKLEEPKYARWSFVAALERHGARVDGY